MVGGGRRTPNVQDDLIEQASSGRGEGTVKEMKQAIEKILLGARWPICEDCL